MSVSVGLPNVSRLFGIGVLAIGMTGCAFHSTFTQPNEQDAAKIRITMANPEKYIIMLGDMDLKTCKIRSQIAWLSGGREKDSIRVGMYDTSPPPQDGIVERLIPVGSPFSIAPKMLIPQVSIFEALLATGTVTGPLVARDMARKSPSTCAFPVFVPEQGKQYELHIDMAPDQCNIILQQLTISKNSNKVTREPVESIGSVLINNKNLLHPQCVSKS